MFTANLTPEVETGVGSWTKNDFISAVENAQIKGENALQDTMQSYVLLCNAAAIFEYFLSYTRITE